MLSKVSRGDVFYCDLGTHYHGCIEGKVRPVVVVSNDMGNVHGTTCIVAPITTREKSSCKLWQVYFRNVNRDQIILLEQLRVVNISDLYDYQGRLDDKTMKQVDIALAVELDLNTSDKELHSTEFIIRLDTVLTNIVSSKLNDYDSKVNEVIEKLAKSIAAYKSQASDVMNNLNQIIEDNHLTNAGIESIKELFNKNSNNLDKILSSLISLYKNINDSSEVKVKKLVESCTEESLKDDVNNKVLEHVNASIKKNKRKRYSVEEATLFITDYYNMNRQEFMNKYELKDKTHLNNKLIVVRNVLKRNGVDYKHIKHKLTVYNINDLPEEEKEAKFSQYIKNTNDSTKVKNDTELIQPELYVEPNREFKGIKGANKGSKQSHRADSFQYSIENCLAFVDEWNSTLFSDMCDKYNMTPKQMSNRKYLICKWLLSKNIQFNVTNKVKERAGRKINKCQK